MKNSRAKNILKLKKATIECNPLRKNGKPCAALFQDEVDELIRAFDEMESFIFKSNNHAK
ncbi:hypothetical protein [Candidatus Stoquefichus sp. SB1]|jgi:hypothetical protein|nr:hypothetical protein [Candidatus Stoquefichus sp. SB1]